MPEALYYKSQPYLSQSQHFLLSNSIAKMNISLLNTFAPKSSLFHSSHQTQIQKPIIRATRPQNLVICARKNKWRKVSQRSTRFLLELISNMASRINILPQPLNLVIGEISGGDGNGLGVWFWKGFDGWRRKRKRKRNLVFFGFLAICGLVLLFGKEFNSNVLCGVLGFALFGVALVQWWEKRGIQDCVLGIFVWGILVGFGFRKEEVQQWVEKVRAFPPIMETVIRRRSTKGRRAF